MELVDQMMNDAVRDGVFPGGVLLVKKEDAILFHEPYGFANIYTGRPVKRETLFDLASLTKPLATTLALLLLMQSNRISPDSEISSIIPEFHGTEKEHITIKHLLLHTSGFPDYKPYFRQLMTVEKTERTEKLRSLLVQEPIISFIGQKMCYSDLGFMVLRWIIERVTGKRIDDFLLSELYLPLGINRLFYIKENRTPENFEFAATEFCAWRDVLLEGIVHDENAYAAGGVEGHAGLFGTADNVGKLLSILLETYWDKAPNGILNSDYLKLFLKIDPVSKRAYGFDVPSEKDSSSGNHFGKRSVGHLGFTGTSFWMDLDAKIIIILLTNRVHPTRENIKIREVRPKIHNCIMESLMGK